MGELVGERYMLLSRLGQGGMATVWRARDERLQREVALKLLDVQEEDDAFYFHREARAAAALSHRNIVPIHDYSGMGEMPPWLVMELIVGETLAELVERCGKLPGWMVAAVGVAIASALQHAHEKGVVHRDVKPENVLIGEDGRVLLTDFGIAKAFDDPARLGATAVADVTRVSGTPAFMAPERLAADGARPASDVFSLGKLLDAVLGESAPTLRQVIARCLQKDPAARPKAAVVAKDLLSELARARVVQTDASIAAFMRGEEATMIATAKALPPPPAPPPKRPRQRTAYAAVLGAAALVAAAIAWWIITTAPAPVKLPPPVVIAEPDLPKPPPNPETVTVPDVPPAPPPVVAPKLRPKVEIGTGTIELVVIPWGKVSLDGAALGVTPTVRELNVASGKHALVFEHPAFGKRHRNVDVRVGHKSVVEVDFKNEQ